MASVAYFRKIYFAKILKSSKIAIFAKKKQ